MKNGQPVQQLFNRGRILLFLVSAVPSFANGQPAGQSGPLREPVYRIASQPSDAPAVQAPSAATEHPLVPAIRYAKARLANIDNNIRDYSCTLLKRERIGGTLNDYESMYVKVRQQPFSVYMYFLAPKSINGRECIFVENRNEGKLIAHEGKGLLSTLPVFRLDPLGMLAMRGQRYPITEIGIRNLTARLVQVAENDLNYDECEVQWYENTTVDGRKCTCIQVKHPVPRKHFRFHLARVFIDDEYQIPIRYAAYQWPRYRGGKPELDEEYTYRNLKFNAGLADADFEERNPNYRFK